MNKNKYLSMLYESGCSSEVITHSLKVYEIAMKIVKKIEDAGMTVNRDLVTIGALLHDIGRSHTHGISHAIEGAKIAQKKGLSPNAISLIEHHIGAGIDKDEAKILGLPIKEYLPISIEEEIVAHADNLSDTTDIESLINIFKKKGHKEGAARLRKLHEKLERLCQCNLGELLCSKSE